MREYSPQWHAIRCMERAAPACNRGLAPKASGPPCSATFRCWNMFQDGHITTRWGVHCSFQPGGNVETRFSRMLPSGLLTPADRASVSAGRQASRGPGIALATFEGDAETAEHPRWQRDNLSVHCSRAGGSERSEKKKRMDPGCFDPGSEGGEGMEDMHPTNSAALGWGADPGRLAAPASSTPLAGQLALRLAPPNRMEALVQLHL